MKQIIGVKSNPIYIPDEQDMKDFKLKGSLELVITFIDGKNYEYSDEGVLSSPKIKEVRMIVDAAVMNDLITQLQLHLENLSVLNNNADKVNSLVRYMNGINKK